MTQKRMSVHDQEILLKVFIFFRETRKFSITAEEAFETMQTRFGACFYDLDNIDSILQEALKNGFISKTGSLFTLNFDGELVDEMIAQQIKNKEIYIAHIDSDIQFLQNYQQEKSKR